MATPSRALFFPFYFILFFASFFPHRLIVGRSVSMPSFFFYPFWVGGFIFPQRRRRVVDIFNATPLQAKCTRQSSSLEKQKKKRPSKQSRLFHPHQYSSFFSLIYSFLLLLLLPLTNLHITFLLWPFIFFSTLLPFGYDPLKISKKKEK